MQGKVPHDAVVEIDDRPDQHVDEPEDESEDVAVGRHHRVHDPHHRPERRQKQHECPDPRLLELEYGGDGDSDQHPRDKEYVERQIEPVSL